MHTTKVLLLGNLFKYFEKSNSISFNEFCRCLNAAEASQETLDLTRKIMIWLIRQRNEFGYFGSTQDTVIGLQAMATYQLWIREVVCRCVVACYRFIIPSI